MLFWRKRKDPHSNGTVFFLFVAGLGTVILASAMLGSGLGRRLLTGDAPDIAVLLQRESASDSVSDVSHLRLEPSDDPLYVYAYVIDGRRRIGLVGWDRRIGGYRLVDEAELDLPGALQVELVSEGEVRQDEMRVVRVSAGSEIGRAIVWIGTDGRSLVPFPVCGPDGDCGEEMVASGSDTLGFEDITGDGYGELLVSELVGSTGVVGVYSWRGSRLEYDQPLSAAMNARDGLFPEP
ncbi:MAG: hypothetical protein ABIJ46_04240 [bacterium]